MQIDNVGFRPVPLSRNGSGDSGNIGVSESFVILRQAAASLDISAPPFVSVTEVIADALEEICVVDIRTEIAEIDGAGLARNGKIILELIAGANGAADVPLVHVGIIFAKPFIDEPLERGGRRRRRVLG